MKRTTSYRPLPLVAAALGIIGLLLRLALYMLKGETGLLPASHPLHIGSLIVAACAAVMLLIFVGKLDGSNRYPDNFPASTYAAAGSLFAGLWLFPVAFDILKRASGNLDIAWAVLCFAAAACLLVTSLYSLKGKQPFFLLHGVLCLYFALHMVCQYRLWSGNPQLEDYLLPLLGCIFLALTAYYRTAFDAGLGKRRMLLFCGLMAVVLCIPSVAGDQDGRFFLAGAVWAGTNLCVIDPPKETKEEPHASA